MDAIRAVIAEERVSRTQIALWAGISETQINRILRGDAKPSYDTHQRLCQNCESYRKRVSAAVA